MIIKNQSTRNLIHRYTTSLQPSAKTQEVREVVQTIRCDKATLVVKDNRLIAYCIR